MAESQGLLAADQTPAQDAQSDQTAQIRRFLSWLLWSELGIMIAMTLAAILLPSLALALIAATELALAVLLIFTRWQASAGRTQPAVITTCVGILAAALLNVIIVPAFMPALILVPVLTIILALPYISRGTLHFLGVIGGAASLAIVLLGLYVQLLPAPPPLVTGAILSVLVIFAVEFIVLLAAHTNGRFSALLQRSQDINARLRASLAETQARSAAQAALLAENERQRETIRELSAPIIPIGGQALLLPLIGALDQERLQLIREQALRAIYTRAARLLVLDITGVTAVDAEVARGLVMIGHAARLLGVEVALVGVGADAAQAMADLDVGLHSITTCRDLETALQLLADARTRR